MIMWGEIMNIISHIPGRIRIRSDKFKTVDSYQAFYEYVSSDKDVIKVTVTELVGSMLIFYEESVDMSEFVKWLDHLWKDIYETYPEDIESRILGAKKKKILLAGINAGMTLTFAGTLLTLVNHRMKRHVYYGSLLTGFVLAHTLIHRKAMLRHTKELMGIG